MSAIDLTTGLAPNRGSKLTCLHGEVLGKRSGHWLTKSAAGGTTLSWCLDRYSSIHAAIDSTSLGAGLAVHVSPLNSLTRASTHCIMLSAQTCWWSNGCPTSIGHWAKGAGTGKVCGSATRWIPHLFNGTAGRRAYPGRTLHPEDTDCARSAISSALALSASVSCDAAPGAAQGSAALPVNCAGPVAEGGGDVVGGVGR